MKSKLAVLEINLKNLPSSSSKIYSVSTTTLCTCLQRLIVPSGIYTQGPQSKKQLPS